MEEKTKHTHLNAQLVEAVWNDRPGQLTEPELECGCRDVGISECMGIILVALVKLNFERVDSIDVARNAVS